MGRCIALAVLGAACSGVPAVAQTLTDTRVRVQTWASGLSSPTTFTWIGATEMLVIQRADGKVKWIQDGVVQGTALDLNVNNTSERGGLGIAADPDFANNSYVYVYYSSTSATKDSSTSSTWVDNRIERYEWNGSTLINGFGPIVAFPMDSMQSNGDNHDGGVIKFGPDGYLYGVTGDLNRGRFGGGAERVEQNTAATGSATVGGMFRLATDGSIPADNPFVGESDTSFHLWYSYGLRNSFGLTFDTTTNYVWDTENGPNLYDEVNRVPSGMNSGWLKIMGPDARNAKYSENGNNSYDSTDLIYLQNSTYLDPQFSIKTPVGITGICFLNSKRFPEDIRDDCLFSDNNTQNLYLADVRSNRLGFNLPAGLTDKVADNNTERDKLKWGAGFGVGSDIQVGADGYLYVVGYSTNKIYVIRPVTDLVEVAEFRRLHNMLTSGKPEASEASDDVYFNIAQKGLFGPYPPYQVGASFQLNATNPTSVVLTVEDHYNRASVYQEIQAFNVTTQAWDLLDTAMVGVVDSATTLTLTTPANYIDPVKKTVEIRIDARLLFPPSHPYLPKVGKALTGSFDQVRLEVTYP